MEANQAPIATTTKVKVKDGYWHKHWNTWYYHDPVYDWVKTYKPGFLKIKDAWLWFDYDVEDTTGPDPVPEPTSLAIWSLLGLVGFGVSRKRRRVR